MFDRVRDGDRDVDGERAIGIDLVRTGDHRAKANEDPLEVGACGTTPSSGDQSSPMGTARSAMKGSRGPHGSGGRQ